MGFGKKEKEMMNHLESVIHGYVFTPRHPGMDVCRKAEVRMVELLGSRGAMIMSEMADRATLSVSTATGVIDGLVEKGLVRRDRSEEDRRIVRVELTSEGQKIYEQALEVRLKMVRGMLGALNKDEQDQFVSLFRKIAETIDKDKNSNLDE